MSSKDILVNPPIPAPHEARKGRQWVAIYYWTLLDFSPCPKLPLTMSKSPNATPSIISHIVDICLTAAPPQIGTSSKAVLINPPIPALPEARKWWGQCWATAEGGSYMAAEDSYVFGDSAVLVEASDNTFHSSTDSSRNDRIPEEWTRIRRNGPESAGMDSIPQES
ncbi:hypothetical protein BDZ97DRAFT_2061964 [Flammula alnicola]|nr:hypothetical protein BDZ97DRAFT_2061964 [Flammula alnicola]